MFGKKTASPKIEDAIFKAINFETTLADMARRSERRAWLVASGSMLLSLVLAAGYFYLLPLKEKVPFMVMADAYTGTSSVARLREDAENQSITTSEAINRSNVAHFLLARESYDIALMNLRDWTTVYTMSSPELSTVYKNLHSSKNPASPFNVYGNGKAIRIKILSISFIGGSPGKVRPKGATVRLNNFGYRDKDGRALREDGGFGDRTKEAVQAYQQAHGLKADGLVGPQTLDALMKSKALPLLSDPRHPDNVLFQQAVKGLEKLGPQAFKNHHELESAAGATVFEAKASGLTSIDHLMQSRNGTGLFAVQGAPNDPTHLRIHLDKAQAAAEPIEKSTVQLQQEAGIAMYLQPLERQQHRSMGL